MKRPIESSMAIGSATTRWRGGHKTPALESTVATGDPGCAAALWRANEDALNPATLPAATQGFIIREGASDSAMDESLTAMIEGQCMFKHIQLPTDGSETSESAIRTGVHLAKALGARVTGLTVIREHDHTGSEVASAQSGTSAHVKEHLHFIEIVANGNGVDCDIMSVSGDSPSEEIIRVAGELGCDLIVMASHGRKGVVALLIGSGTRNVLARAHLPVLVCR